MLVEWPRGATTFGPVASWAGAAEILPAVWVTGPVERKHRERTYPRFVDLNIDGEWIEDWVPEETGTP